MAGSVSIWKIYGFPKASFYQERSVPRHATAYIHKRCATAGWNAQKKEKNENKKLKN